MRVKKIRIILAYHRTNDARDVPIALRAVDFEAQLHRLREGGFESISLSTFKRWYISGDDSVLPTHAVVLTFDDGYFDNFRTDMPLLQKYGFFGTFFLPTGLIGTDALLPTDKETGSPETDRVVTWDEARAMCDAGMEIGGHTRHHAVLTQVDFATAKEEIHGCMEDIVKHLGKGEYFFCYPKNVFSPEIVEVVRRAGFAGAVVTPTYNRSIPRNDPFLMRRVGIHRYNSLRVFDWKVRGWYDLLRETPCWRLFIRLRS